MVEGWLFLVELQVGMWIVVLCSVLIFGKMELFDYLIKILGYLFGDGDVIGIYVCFMNGNVWVMVDFVDSLSDFGGFCWIIDDSKGIRMPMC